MTVYIVTGLGYGDEGKGTTVDFLANQGHSLVVRHNGGPQAGHNVVLPNGKHHEFSQFGSGTFAGASTFLSRFVLVNPGNMMLEAEHLGFLGVNDLWERLYIDEDARIITPFHIALQRLQAYAHGGSCGKGIGEAMRQDIERPDLTIRVKDIPRLDTEHKLWNDLLRKLNDQRKYLLSAHQIILPAISDQNWQLLSDEHLSSQLADDYHDWRKLLTVVNQTWLVDQYEAHQHVIFEGAQGVLLDEHHGFHPYTTWSTTTPKNAMQLINETYQGPVQRLGVTRAYATRHGNGPFVTEDKGLDFAEPHNHDGGYQGAFRQGHLDLVALRYAIIVSGGIDGLVVTHLDRADYWNVVDAYATKEFYDIRDISLNLDPKDLARQEQLTRQLMKARAVYGLRASHTGDELLAKLEAIAPIAIQSYGPTAKDKVWVNQWAMST